MKRNVYLCIVAMVIAAVFFVGGALMTAEVLSEGNMLAFSASLAQIIPGVYQQDKDYDIPTVTDLSPIATFWQVREKIKTHYVYPVEDDKTLTYGAIRGMLAALKDPYSRFLDPQEFKDFRTESEGHFDGIGAVLEAQTDDTGHERVVISDVIPEGPAATTDLRFGDQIVKVDGKATKGQTLYQVVRQIRGKRGTPVVLTLVREGLEDSFDVEIIRAEVQFPTLESEMLDDKIGYIWLRSFNQLAEEKMTEAIDELTKQGMEALLLDMSTDPGGILDAAVTVASFFLDGGPVVYIKARDTDPQPLNASPGTAIPEDMPMLVLVNRGSASASEIVAGALKERGRAEVAGHRTFGKAKVQTIIEMRDGSALFLSTAVYLTPELTDLGAEDAEGNRGVKPDHLFADPEPDATYSGEEWHQKQIDQAIEILKAKKNA